MKFLAKTSLYFSIFLILSISVWAQDEDNVINYGDIVTGEITNEEFEVEYTFTGNEGDVVIIEMNEVDTLSDLRRPDLILLDTTGRVFLATDGYSSGNALLAVQLPSDGDYVIIATRRDGRSGDSIGEYTLELILPSILTVDEPVNGTLSSEGRTQYYLVGTTEPFSVMYDRELGDMFPQFSVNILDSDDGGLLAVASADGDQLERALLGTFSSNFPYIVTVGRALFDINFREVTVDFNLELSIDE